MAHPLLALCYDRLLRASEEAGLAARRQALLASAAGAVLEIGAGTGLNLPHYPVTVDRLVLSDPDPFMRRRLRRRIRDRGAGAEVVDAPVERLPFLENTFDEVVCTLVLCSVERRVTGLHEIRRVLRPGGRLRFLEHVAATPEGPSRGQRLAAPAQRVLFGCRLDLQLPADLQAAGLIVDALERWSLPRAPAWMRPAVVGVARAPAWAPP